MNTLTNSSPTRDQSPAAGAPRGPSNRRSPGHRSAGPATGRCSRLPHPPTQARPRFFLSPLRAPGTAKPITGAKGESAQT